MKSQSDIKKYLGQGDEVLTNQELLKDFNAAIKLVKSYFYGEAVEKNEELASKIINAIYEKSRSKFVDGIETRYPEIALAKGYFKEQSSQDTIDLYHALWSYLEAREALRMRKLDEGDKTLSFEIYKRIRKIKKKLKVKDRVIKNGGYLLEYVDDYWSACDIRISKKNEGYYLINIIPPLDSFALGVHEVIYFLERVKNIQYLVHDFSSKLDKILEKKIESIQIEDKTLDICFVNEGFLELYHVDEVYYVPQNITQLNKHITVVETVDDKENINFYTLNGKHKLEEIEHVLCEKLNIKIKIKEINYVYDDEVPLGATEL